MSATTILIGRLVEAIKIKQTVDGRDYGYIRLAVRRTYKDKHGKYPTDFFALSVFGESNINNLQTYTTKGSLIEVHGNLETNSTTDEEGNNRTYVNIIPNRFVFLANPSTNKEKEERNISNGETGFENSTEVLEETIEIENKSTIETEEIFQNEIPNFFFNPAEHPFH